MAHKDNIVIGSGRLFIQLIDSDGNLVGKTERYMGDSPGMTIGGESTRQTIFASDGSDRSRRLVDRLRDVQRRLTLTLRDVSMDNLKLFLAGEGPADTYSVAVVDESFGSVKTGDWLQLGSQQATDADTKAQGGVAAVNKAPKPTAKDGNAAIPPADVVLADDDVHYDDSDKSGTQKLRIFPANGRVLALADIADLKISYTPVARKRVVSATESIEAAVRYVEDSDLGKPRNVYCTRGRIGPNGDYTVKAAADGGDGAAQSLPLAVEVLDKLVIDGEDAA